MRPILACGACGAGPGLRSGVADADAGADGPAALLGSAESSESDEATDEADDDELVGRGESC
jgi:hypothetical protein